jgi:phosphatidylinositol alpha-1,6-mannosyltransferase
MHRLVQHWTRVEARVVTLNVEGAEEFDGRQSFGTRRVVQMTALGRAGAVGVLNGAALAEACRFRPDVVLSGHLAVSPAAWAVRRAVGTPYVQYLYAREVVVRPRLSRFALRHAAGIIAISGYTARLALAHGAAAENMHRIPPGVDVTPRSSRPRASRPTIVSVARLEERYKGHDVLIRALPLVRARVPGARLVLVGSGPLAPAYARLADSLDVAASVEFAGPLDDAARDAALDEAHVFAMPSRLARHGGGEGFGIVYLEAAVHGLPVVAGNVAGAVDAVVDGRTGLLVDPTDHVAVADAISKLLARPGEAAAMGRAAYERSRQFAWPKIAERVEDVLIGVAGAR